MVSTWYCDCLAVLPVPLGAAARPGMARQLTPKGG